MARDDHSDSNCTTVIETSNVHSDKENESPSKLSELSKNRPFQKRLERRRRRQQKRLELLYIPFRKRKLPANFFQPPSSPHHSSVAGTACYYSNPYSTYNPSSSSNYYNSSYGVTPSLEQNTSGVSAGENDVAPSSQYNGTFYETSAFYDPLSGHSGTNEPQSSVKVKTEIEPNQLLNYSNN